MTTVKDLLSLEISIDVVDDVTDDLWIAFDGPITLTEAGKRRFASVLDLPVVVPGVSEDDGIHTIFLNGETACILINDREDWERLELKCKDLFESLAGYCSESNWNKWFRF